MQTVTPKIKTADILVQNLNGEVLIYNLKTNKAFCLNETCAEIYKYCDGQNTFADIRRKSRKDFSDEVIWLAIEELNRQDLLAEKTESGISRRNLLEKAAVSAFALPLVMSLIAPSAARAQSATCAPDGTPTGGQTTRAGDFICFYDEDNPPEPPCCSGTANVNYDSCVPIDGSNYICDCVCGPVTGDSSIIRN